MRRRRAATAAAFAVIAAIVGLACGGDGDFADAYNEATEPLAALDRELSASTVELGRGTPTETADQFIRLAGMVRGVNAELADLEPPDGAAADFDRLRGSLERGERDLRAFAAAARAEDPQALGDAAEAIAADGAAITRAETDLKRALAE